MGPADGVDLTLNKTVDNTTPHVGQIITFTVTVNNQGPGNATGIEVQDIMPPEIAFITALANKGTYDEGSGVWEIGDLANGFQAGLTVQAEVLPSAAGAPVTNSAFITALDQPDPDSSNDADSIDFNVPTSDLQVSLNSDLATANVGDTINYTIRVLNGGPSLATGIVVEDLLPESLNFVSASPSQGSFAPLTGLWSLGSLNPAIEATLTLTTTVTAMAIGTNVINTASVWQSDQADLIPGNNSFSTMVTVPGADLDVTLTPSTLVAKEAEEIQYTITLGNGGPDQAAGIHGHLCHPRTGGLPGRQPQPGHIQ